MNPKKSIPRHVITKMSKCKDNERTLKAAREKQLVIYKEIPRKATRKTFAGQKGVA